MINSSNRLLFPLVMLAVALGGIVGGLPFSIFVLSIVSVTVICENLLPKRVQFCALVVAFLVNLSWVMFFLNFILGLTKTVGILSWMSVNTTAKVFHPMTMYSVPQNGLSQAGALVVLALPTFASALVFISQRYKRAREKRGVEINSARINKATYLSASVPLLVIAVLKLINKWQVFALVMSGDGRNHFLWIEEIRTTSSISIGLTKITSPTLSHGLAVLFSAANGATGVLQKSDVFAMLTVYTVSAVLMATVAATFFVVPYSRNPDQLKMKFVAPGAIVSGFIFCSGYVLGNSLRDGFMSLYLGVAVLGVVFVIYYIGSSIPSYSWCVASAVSTWVLIGAYSFLLPPALALNGILVLRTLKHDSHRGRRNFTVFFLLLGLAGTIVYGLVMFWERMLEVAAFFGSVASVDLNYLWLFTVIGILVAFWSKAEVRWFTVGISCAAITTVIAVELVEMIPENSAATFSYYSSKMIMGVTGALFLLLPMGIGHMSSKLCDSSPIMLNRSGQKNTAVMATLGLLALLPLMLIDAQTSTQNPITEIQKGWITPDAGTASEVLAHWQDGPTVYFRFVDNPKQVSYPSIGYDRLANIWAPAFWGSEGSWAGLWNWVYSDLTSAEATTLCVPLKFSKFTVFTRDPLLELQVNLACPGTQAKFVLYPRVMK
jgi:hypothetical protein